VTLRLLGRSDQCLSTTRTRYFAQHEALLHFASSFCLIFTAARSDMKLTVLEVAIT